MNTKRQWFIKSGVLTALTAAMLALAPHAVATTVHIGFNGGGGSGHVTLTIGPDTTAGDPAGALLITNASGTFSDTNLPGLSNVSITGVMTRNFATPFDVADGTWQPGFVPFPASFSTLPTANAPAQDNGVTTFSELFYAGGSPQTCWDYPFAGGFLDPYGVMFTLGNGDVVDLFSFGDIFVPTMSPVYLTYGFEVIDPSAGGNLLDAQGGVRAAVPEPDFLWLFGAAVLGLFAWRRKVEKKA
jgi:hypothetical protein